VVDQTDVKCLEWEADECKAYRISAEALNEIFDAKVQGKYSTKVNP